MVRHEAAEAVGAIGEGRLALESFLDDVNLELAQSCKVALDLLNFCD
jgi:hypothetical protein